MVIAIAELEGESLVKACIQLVRTGSFITVFRSTKALEKLRHLVDSRPDWLGATSRAVLAETYDQVGCYRQAGELATRDIGLREIKALEEEIHKSEPVRDVVRAQAWLVLQCAVSQFRQEGGQQHALDLLTTAIELIDANKGQPVASQHIQSLFYFWRGRIHTSRYEFALAEEAFQKALDVADRTLEEKLRQVELHEDADNRTKEHYKELIAGNYILSTCLGFGLGQLRQLEGRLLDSLQFLKVAVPLSRGSGDFHRRGYAHMLMGTALRSQNALDAADRELEEAQRLFGEPEKPSIPPHHLHLARVQHQLALSKYNRVPLGGGTSDQDKAYLEDAERLNEHAAIESNHESCNGYSDPMLAYGIKVARSLIKTALGDYHEAHTQAQLAIGSIKEHYLPRGTHGWAWVAKGMALAEGVQDRGQAGQILDAETAFHKVIDDPDVRVTDFAAAHLHLSRLYSKIGQPFKAAVHYDLARPEKSEHGWIHDLAAKAKEALGNSIGYECTFNIQQLLKAGEEQDLPVWNYISQFIDGEVQKRLLRLKQDTLSEENGAIKAALELGISRATIFKWRNNADLRDLIPSPKPKRPKRNKD